MVIVLAGRRIDALNAETSRFPLESKATVQQRLHDLFLEVGATHLICAAACGADLIALDVAGQLGVRRRVVLPFDTKQFREMSVTDRPGDWGSAFDEIIAEVQALDDLVIIPAQSDPHQAFEATNKTIFDEAALLAPKFEKLLAVLVWDGKSRGEDDLTADFGREAHDRGMPVTQIPTCE